MRLAVVPLAGRDQLRHDRLVADLDPPGLRRVVGDGGLQEVAVTLVETQRLVVLLRKRTVLRALHSSSSGRRHRNRKELVSDLLLLFIFFG